MVWFMIYFEYDNIVMWYVRMILLNDVFICGRMY